MPFYVVLVVTSSPSQTPLSIPSPLVRSCPLRNRHDLSVVLVVRGASIISNTASNKRSSCAFAALRSLGSSNEPFFQAWMSDLFQPIAPVPCSWVDHHLALRDFIVSGLKYRSRNSSGAGFVDVIGSCRCSSAFLFFSCKSEFLLSNA